ncbi:MAG: hypothetical protein LIO92_01560 [Clostridiales bacterium]|nr:hypothetical protein [Clostridiales bacterium]
MEAAVKTDQYRDMLEIENNTKEVRAMVMDSYQDMLDGKGRDYKEFFQELENDISLKCFLTIVNGLGR